MAVFAVQEMKGVDLRWTLKQMFSARKLLDGEGSAYYSFYLAMIGIRSKESDS
jgi:hypothetical protein